MTQAMPAWSQISSSHSTNMEPSREEFFRRGSVKVAKALLGLQLVNLETGAAGTIVETEAYPGEEDPACHYNGESTKRGKVFEKGPGTVYVYSIHGSECMNFICGSEDYPEGVLVRALKPEKGIDAMREKRGFDDVERLCSGPGMLVEAMGISKERDNGRKLGETPLRIGRRVEEPDITCTPRIGVSKAKQRELRYAVRSSKFTSR